MKIKEVIVVEGKHDTETLKKYLECDTIETQGSHLSKATLQMLKEVNKTRGLIVFMDPDSPGEKIRARIVECIPEAKHAFIQKAKAKTHKKVGVEHAKKEDILIALQHLVTYKKNYRETISQQDILELGLNGQANSAALRETIGDVLFIGKCNAKQIRKRLNMLEITREQLERIIKQL